MTAEMTAQTVEDAARALLDERIQAVRELATAREKVATKRGELDDVERADAGAYAAALRSGWKADELKKIGLDAPAPVRKTASRQRKDKPTTAKPDAAPAT